MYYYYYKIVVLNQTGLVVSILQVPEANPALEVLRLSRLSRKKT